MEELSQYDLKILHRPGKKYANEDILSFVPGQVQTCEELRSRRVGQLLTVLDEQGVDRVGEVSLHLA